MKAVHSIREPLKKPRPLKTASSSELIKQNSSEPKEAVILKSKEAIFEDLEILNVSVSNCNFDEVTVADISRMCAILKKRGEELDAANKDAMDRYYCTLRNASREEQLDIVSRLRLLETIELRARNWKKNENIDNYFSTKISEIDHKQASEKLVHSPSVPNVPLVAQMQNSSSVPLQHGEILRSSGKFTKPTKIAGKNYFKDEIVIRNSDSGKVMGIKGRRVHMIEELSDTVISFQRVNPGARDRLVQITGPHEDAIGHAKVLVEDTIRRNASPLRENAESGVLDNKEHLERSLSPLDNAAFLQKRALQHSFSVGDATVGEFTAVVNVGVDSIKLSGSSPDIVKTAKLVLKQFFAEQSKLHEKNRIIQSPHIQAPVEKEAKYDLKRQSSLRSSLDNSFSTSWKNGNQRQDSISTLSSSDEDVLREEGRDGVTMTSNQISSPHDSVLNSSKSFNSMSTDSSITLEKFSRSSSVPSEFSGFNAHSPDGRPHSRSEVFSPVLCPDPEALLIPPPSYKKQTYTRDFLLGCARSPFSRLAPPNFTHIGRSFHEIVAVTPVMFDPEKYQGTKVTEE